MKLKEVKHVENFLGEEVIDDFNIHNNRFVLFDKMGRKLNECKIECLPNYLDLEVIEIKKSGYSSLAYFVGYPTTHIKLDILDDKLLVRSGSLFGVPEVDYAH